MQEEWREFKQATISSRVQWFWLNRRFDRSQMKVHFTSPPGTADTVIHGPRSLGAKAAVHLLNGREQNSSGPAILQW